MGLHNVNISVYNQFSSNCVEFRFLLWQTNVIVDSKIFRVFNISRSKSLFSVVCCLYVCRISKSKRTWSQFDSVVSRITFSYSAYNRRWSSFMLTIEFESSRRKSTKILKKKMKITCMQKWKSREIRATKQTQPAQHAGTFQIDFEFESRKIIYSGRTEKEKLRTKIIIKYVFIFLWAKSIPWRKEESFFFPSRALSEIYDRLDDKNSQLQVSLTLHSHQMNSLAHFERSQGEFSFFTFLRFFYFLYFDILCMWTLSIVFLWSVFPHEMKWMKFNDSTFVQKNGKLYVDCETLNISHQR